MASGSGTQQLDLNKLPLPQLAQLKQQLDQEMSVFQDSIQTLQMAKNKFAESGDVLDKIVNGNKGKQILVPLTSSMYVPGTLVDTENVIIDIGTGYFAKKDVVGGIDYFKRKVLFVTDQIEKITMLGNEKSKLRDAITHLLEVKVQTELQAKKASTS